MFFSGGFIEKEAGGFDHDIRADFVPFQLGWIAHLREADFFAVDHQVVAVHRDVALEFTVHGIVLQRVGQVIRLQQIVDADDFDVGKILRCGAKHHASDAAKTVDAYFDCHHLLLKTIN